jgi:hypothetical protein
VRAAAFAGAGTLLAVVAHRLGGGQTPSLAVGAGAFGVLYLVGLLCNRRELSGRLLATLVISTQLVLHVGFAMFAMSGGRSGQPMWVSMLICHAIGRAPSAAELNAARASVAGSTVTAASSTASAMSEFGAAALLMLAAHLAAACALAWWLRRGEKRTWAAVQRVITTLRQVIAPWQLSISDRMVVTVRPEVGSSPGRLWTALIIGRGPPRASGLSVSFLGS